MNSPEGNGRITAVVFDVYGTLVEIRDRRRPYARLLQWLAESGRVPRQSDARRLMSTACDLAGTARLFGVELSATALASLENDLAAELASVALYPDVIETLTVLRQAGIRLGVCSNLAAPYATPVLELLPFTLEAYAWSFELGTVKPDPAIYRAVCQQLDCVPHETLFVGDTLAADYEGPRAIGMPSLHLARKGPSQAEHSIATLAEVPMIVRHGKLIS
ncbi:HAD family hydrolase [Oxalobacteraceae bacterium R-40]|uniref:HAD family hydrolase n=1 Tax=Keguizhuia sedimenti TaxID=3064264 RepID=A0ABU1BWK5_9BURK|nr:HAD family hydrolase [Oxalobacteraceae bacterium R-40]